MYLHKFGIKPENNYIRRQPMTIYWKPVMDVKHPPQKLQPVTWLIFNQDILSIKPKESKTISLRFGFDMTQGMVLVSLKQELKMKQCSIQNEVVLESVNDVVININYKPFE